MIANPLISRVLALALLAVAGLLVWFGAVTPYRAALANDYARLDQAAAQLQQYRRLSTTGETGAAIDARLLLPGATVAAAAAYLQQYSGTLAQQSGAMLLSFELLPPAADPAPLLAIAGRVRMTGNSDAARAMLHGLESHRPLLLLDNVFILARSNSDTIPGGHLDIQFDVTGFRAPPQERGQ